MMKKLTALFLALLLSLPAFALSEAEKIDPAALLESMSTQQKIAQLLMPAFYYYVNGEGRTVSLEEIHPDIEAVLKEYGFGGVIFNLQNAKDNEKATRLVDAMQAANASVPGRPQLLTFTDQEGGYVTRLAQGTQMPGNMALGAADDPAVTENTGFLIGQEVTAIGYSGAFAPVLDVNSNPANPVIGIRSFSDDPETVAEQGVAFMNGLRKAGALSALKHFPGHGDTDTDSHTGLPCVNKTYEELKAFELIPFQEAIDAGADMVMTAHIVYPQVETDTYTSRKTGEEIGLPATLSKTILTDILRGDMGFEGLIVSDAMNMDAIAAHFDPLDAAKLAIEAGVDLILMPVDTSTPEGLSALKQYIQDVAVLADSGTLSMEAVDAAVLRVLSFKEKHGMLTSYVCEDLEAKVQQAVTTVGSKIHHETEFEIAKKAVTLVKNEGVFPLNPEESVAVLVPYSSELMSAEYAVRRLKDEGKLSEDAPVSVLYLGNMTVNDLVKTAQKNKHLIVIHAAYSLNGMNPFKTNGSDSVIVEALLTLAHAAGSDVTVISAQLPYDAGRFPDADAVIVAYGARGMSEDPRNKEYGISQYGPNLPAAVYMALSGQYMTGKLPVNIPALNENCEYTDEILYPRGYSAALTELSEKLKAFYTALVDGWKFLNEEGTSAAYGDGFLQAELTDNAITITETYDEEEPLTWTFVQEGDWLTAPLGPDEDEGRSMAYLLLNNAISAQGVKKDLFLGSINALTELQSKYLTYDESDGEKKVSVNIAGPYEYDLDAMDGLAISEAYLLEEGWKPLLGEDYKMISLPYGKVEVFGAATKDGLYVTISEYGGLDDLAFQAIVSFVKVLQPKGWENFIAEYTELKDAETVDYSVKVNLDEAGMEDAWMKYQEGYGYANFIIGDNLLDAGMLEAIYDALIAEGSSFSDIAAIFAEYMEGAVLAATLEDDGITITLSFDGEVYSAWRFVQDGDWLAAEMEPDDTDGEGMAGLVLLASVSAHGADPFLFDGYVSIHEELDGKYRVIEENGTEKKVSINIAGPYEYDLEEMNGKAITEAYVRDGGRGPLGPDYFTGTVIYGKVSVEYIGNEDGAEFTVKEYGELDDLALQGIISVVSVLQPKGWEDFVASYTEMKDAQEASFTARVNLEGAALLEVDSHPEKGYSYAFFTVGSTGEE